MCASSYIGPILLLEEQILAGESTVTAVVVWLTTLPPGHLLQAQHITCIHIWSAQSVGHLFNTWLCSSSSIRSRLISFVLISIKRHVQALSPFTDKENQCVLTLQARILDVKCINCNRYMYLVFVSLFHRYEAVTCGGNILQSTQSILKSCLGKSCM